MANLELRLLGGFEARVAAGSSLVLPTRKSKALLAFLALQPRRTHSREKLAGMLWGGSGDSRARVSLRQTLTRLRKALGDADHRWIRGEGDALSVDAVLVRVDVLEFERLCEEGTPRATERAAGLYSGDLLEEFHLDESGFDEWLEFERARLRERAIGTMTVLLDHCIGSDEPERGIAIAHRLLALDPLQEHVHRALMRFYSRQGRRQSALNQYRACRDLLERELGIAPDAETDSLRRAAEGRDSTSEPRASRPVASGIARAARSRAANVLRQATVVCAELARLEELTDDVDAARIHSLVDRFVDTSTRVVEETGGTVDHRTGSSLTAIFGVPVAHGNDAERAIEAATSISTALAGLGEETGLDVSARIGIDAGRVLVDGGEGPGRTAGATGPPVDGARRLCDLAKPGEVLAADVVRRAVRTVLDAERAGIDGAAGGADNEPPWRVRAFDPNRHRATRTPFVGRTRELRQFRRALDACIESGRGEVDYVRGEAGIGKTRLVEEIARIAESNGFSCHAVEILDFGVGAALDPVYNLVCSLLGVSERFDLDARAAAVERALDTGDLDRDQRVFLNDLLDLPHPPALRATYDAMDEGSRVRGKWSVVNALFERVSGRNPMLVIVEDVHWAQREFLDHLSRLVPVVARCRALLVMTARTESDPLGAEWRGAIRGSPMLTMDLAALRDEDARALSACFVEPSRAFARRCIDRAQGNPLFLEQLLRGDEGGQAREVPPSIRSLVLARTDQLPEVDREALLVASVLGQRFSLEAIRYLIVNASYSPVRLSERHFVRADGDTFTFCHALVRDAVYDSVLESRRRTLHRRAAAWFAEIDSTVRAEHLERGRDPGAPRAYLTAALEQNQRHRDERALELVRHGLALAVRRGDRFDILEFAGVLLRNLGSLDSCIETFQQALDAAEVDDQRCRAWIGLAGALRDLGRTDEAFEHLRRAEKLAGENASEHALARIHTLRGNLCFPLGRLDECLREHELARRYARRARSPAHEAQALGGLGDAEYARGRMVTAHQHFERCIARSRRHGFGRIEVAHLSMLAATRMYLNRLRSSLRVGREAVEAARRVGHRRAEMLASGIVGNTLFEMARFGDARQAYEEALVIAHLLDSDRFRSVYLHGVGKSAACEGRCGDGMELLERSLALCRKVGMTFNGAAVLGSLALCTDDVSRREEALSEGETLLGAGCVSHGPLRFYRDAIEIALRTGEWSVADGYASALERFTVAEPLPWSRYFVERGRALAALGRGDGDGALVSAIDGLIGEAERIGLGSALPELYAVRGRSPQSRATSRRGAARRH